MKFQSTVHKFNTHFSYSQSRVDKLWAFCDLLGLPKLKPQPDNCETRIAGLHKELIPIARMAPACAQYSSNAGLTVGKGGIDERTCIEAAEVESVLRQVKCQTTLAQSEKAWTGAYRQVLPEAALSSLQSSNGLDVISVPKSVQAGTVVRVKRAFSELSEVGRVVCERAVKRAKLQQEKVGFVTSKRDKVAMLLDPRVINSSAFDGATRAEAKLILEEEYIKHYLTANPPATREPNDEATPALAVESVFGGVMSEDSDSSEAGDDVATAVAKKQFHSEMKHWKKAVASIDWASTFPHIDWVAYKANTAGLSGPEQLIQVMDLDLSSLFLKFLKNPKLPHLPKMVLTVLGNNLASSYVERMNSAGKLILHKGRILLSDHMLNMLVVIRMNRKFMEFMRENYPNLAAIKHKMSLDEQ